jgi:hypothetical protein
LRLSVFENKTIFKNDNRVVNAMVRKRPESKEKKPDSKEEDNTRTPGWTAAYSLETGKSLYYQAFNRFIIYPRKIHRGYVVMQAAF